MKELDEFLNEIENFYKNINFFGNSGSITLNDKEPAKITLLAIDKILNGEEE